ncbi:hypothetical protein [Williamsia sp. CHRR-6]|uniref:hypothetical protein n=1 Tax=Williamsia sp. CHRR-6 TaxID=2835871 RepID=UPI001BD9B7B8|nr:hypothetical protein [Williamsia sp. CHRR-6]MBT0567778.1 hypothetical protein [Williamsia sp. CHRR-6]
MTASTREPGSTGFRYWRRRVVFTVFFVVLLLLSTWISVIIIDLIATQTHGVIRVILLAVAGAGLLWSFAYGFSLLRRTDDEKRLGVPMIMHSGSTEAGRTAAGRAGVTMGILGGPLVLFAQLFVVGVLAAALVASVQRYNSIEEFERATGKKVPRRTAARTPWTVLSKPR